MVSLVQPSPASLELPKPQLSKPLLRRATLSGTIRKGTDAGLDSDILSAPPSPSKRAKVTFNPNVEEKVLEQYSMKGRSLESVRAEIRRAIDGHLNGDSDGYDSVKEIFSPKQADSGERGGETEEMRAYLIALTNYVSLLNKNCSGLVKTILACEWIGRDEKFVRAYVHFLGSLASAQGAYIGMVLGMLVGYFSGCRLLLLQS